VPWLPLYGYRFPDPAEWCRRCAPVPDGGRQPDGGHWFSQVRALFLRCLRHRGRRMSPLVDKPANSSPKMLK